MAAGWSANPISAIIAIFLSVYRKLIVHFSAKILGYLTTDSSI